MLKGSITKRLTDGLRQQVWVSKTGNMTPVCDMDNARMATLVTYCDARSSIDPIYSEWRDFLESELVAKSRFVQPTAEVVRIGNKFATEANHRSRGVVEMICHCGRTYPVEKHRISGAGEHYYSCSRKCRDARSADSSIPRGRVK